MASNDVANTKFDEAQRVEKVAHGSVARRSGECEDSLATAADMYGAAAADYALADNLVRAAAAAVHQAECADTPYGRVTAWLSAAKYATAAGDADTALKHSRAAVRILIDNDKPERAAEALVAAARALADADDGDGERTTRALGLYAEADALFAAADATAARMDALRAAAALLVTAMSPPRFADAATTYSTVVTVAIGASRASRLAVRLVTADAANSVFATLATGDVAAARFAFEAACAALPALVGSRDGRLVAAIMTAVEAINIDAFVDALSAYEAGGAVLDPTRIAMLLACKHALGQER